MSEEAIEQVAQPEAVLETPAEVAQGGSGNDFLQMIPEELRDHPSISPIKDVENLARSYVNAQRLIGADKIPMPHNPTDEDLDRIYSRLGRPESPDQYQFSVDGNIVTEEVAQQYADIAHQLRLTPEQASGVLDYYKSVVENTGVANMQQVEAQRAQAEEALRQEWGNNYDAIVTRAAKTAQEFADPEVFDLDLADGTKLGNNPEFIKAFAKIAEFRQSVTSEDTVSEPSQTSYMTREQAQAEANAIMMSPVYTDKSNIVARQQAVERVQELYRFIHGE
jgi:hypothetical protein